MRSEGEKGHGGPSCCNDIKSARLSKTGSCNSRRSTSDIGSRNLSPCNSKKSARLIKSGSRNSRIMVVDANSGSPLLSKSTCNFSQTSSSERLYSSRPSQKKSARSCAFDVKEGMNLASERLTSTMSSKNVPKSTAKVDILESRYPNTSTRPMKSSLSTQERVRSGSAVNSNRRFNRTSSIKSKSSTDKEGNPASSDSSQRYSRSNASLASSTMFSTARTIRSENGRERVRNGSLNGSLSTKKSNENNVGKLPEIKSSRSVSSASVNSCESSIVKLPSVSASKCNANNASKASSVKSAVRPVSARVAGSRIPTPISPTTQSSLSDKSTTRNPRQATTQSSCKSAMSKKSATPRIIPSVIPARTRSATYTSTASKLKDNSTRPYSSGSVVTKSVTFSNVFTVKK